MKNSFTKFMKSAAFAAVACMLLPFSSCQDKVDDGDMYSFTGMLIYDFLSKNDSTTKFAELTKKVRLSKKSQSTVADLLSVRGNFTCFAPTNEAVQLFIDSVYNTKNFPVEECPDSTAEQIVNNALIDSGNDEAYLSTSFQVGAFDRTSFSDRYITCGFDTLTGGRLAVWINSRSLVISADHELENGVVHIVDCVVSPSNETIGALISNTDNLRIFAHLLAETGWDQKIMKFRDERYEESHPLFGRGCSTEDGGADQPCPSHRDQGYTIFTETDSVFQAVWGVPEFQYAANGDLSNWDDIMAVIRQKCQEVYSDAKNPDPKELDNALNQFVSYHILPEAITYNQLVIHYNEQGYGYRTIGSLGIDAWEYYETLGGTSRRLLKIMEGTQTEGKRINRYVSERDLSNYRELTVPRKGILVMETNGGRDYNALNGYYYAIDDVLLYDNDVPNLVLNERLRFDICSLLPEQITNGFRRPNVNQRYHIPNKYELGDYQYFDNMSFTDETVCNYLPGFASGWRNYQGDEYNIEGQYDVIVKLPPVPFYGTYQIRYGTQNVADRRSMCQFYFGENKDHLAAIGLPLDMRISGTLPHIGFKADGSDPDANDENDHVMAVHEYMKAPYYYGTNNATATTNNFRNDSQVLRRIVVTTTMDPKKTYYLRMKSVLESTTKQLFIDYFELVPKNIYAGAVAEDKW